MFFFNSLICSFLKLIKLTRYSTLTLFFSFLDIFNCDFKSSISFDKESINLSSSLRFNPLFLISDVHSFSFSLASALQFLSYTKESTESVTGFL